MIAHIAQRAAALLRHPGISCSWLAKRAYGIVTLDTVYLECVCPLNPDRRSPLPGRADEKIGLMRMETFSAVARRLLPYAFAVDFAGRGEPLLNPDLARMIRVARSYRLESRVSTDGLFMDEAIVCELIAAGTDSIAVSLDAASPAIHDAKRGVGSFDTTTYNMDVFQKVKRKLRLARPALLLDTVITRSNRREIGSLLELARELGAEGVNLAHPQECRRAEKSESLPDTCLEDDYRSWEKKAGELGLMLNIFGDPAYGAGRLWDPSRRLAVTWEGELRPCLLPPHPGGRGSSEDEVHESPPSFGNLMRISFASIWRSREYHLFRQSYRHA